MREEQKSIREKVKKNIFMLVEKNKLNAASALLDQYANMAPDDIEVFSMQGVVEFRKGKLETAIQAIKKGLRLEPENFDLLYNLACIYELQKDYEEAHNVLQNMNDSKYSEYQELLKPLRKKVDANYAAKKNNTKKFAFFVKPRMDSFLGDIISLLENDYIVKKYIVTDAIQIDEGMEWADVCWFEWCDEVAIYGSKLKAAQRKKVICRLHSYEAFTEYPLQVEWENIDHVVFVAEHIREYLLENVSNLKKEKTSIIPNGIDLTKYAYKVRKRGFNIAYVGYINWQIVKPSATPRVKRLE